LYGSKNKNNEHPEQHRKRYNTPKRFLMDILQTQIVLVHVKKALN